MSLSLLRMKAIKTTNNLTWVKAAQLALVFSCIVFYSCSKDNTFFEGNARIELSADTLFFDTLFTRVGSATQYFKIYNRELSPVLVNISQAGGLKQYRFNVDGREGLDDGPYEIGPNDSIYVFVEVTVQPDAPLSVSPFFIEDQVLIQQGDRQQAVQLVAYGQNANYIPVLNARGGISLLSCDLGTITWTDEKPYVIYGVLVIDSCTLVLPEACKVYVHGGVVVNEQQVYNDGQIIVLKHGKIKAMGSAEKKVIITGDRPEETYQHLAGQWGGIRFVDGSKDNAFSDVLIRNAIVGIIADSATTVELNSVEISDCAVYGIYARHADTKAQNVLIHNTGSSALALIQGGNHRYDYCTFNTTLNQDESLTISNFYCTDPLCQELVLVHDLNFTITNSIITGASTDEISLRPFADTDVGNSFKYSFSNCLVRVKDLLKPLAFPNFLNECVSCIVQENNRSVFADEDKYNFRPDSMSVVLDKAVPLPFVTRDIEGKPRNATTPDMGCYEQ